MPGSDTPDEPTEAERGLDKDPALDRILDRRPTPLAAPDPDELRALCSYPMPFGRYKGRVLIDLPEPYVVWWKSKGFPDGKLGHLLALAYEVKLNGLEGLVRESVRRGG